MIKFIEKILLRLNIPRMMFFVFMIMALIRWHQGMEHHALWMLIIANMMLTLER